MPRNREYFGKLKDYWFRGDARIFYVKIDHYAKLIYLYLASVLPTIDPSEDKIAEYLGIAPGTVRKRLALLVENNILAVNKGPKINGRNGRNIYTFVDHSQWKLKTSIENAFKKLNQCQAPEMGEDDGAESIRHPMPDDHVATKGGTTSSHDEPPPHPVMNNNRIKPNEANETHSDDRPGFFKNHEKPKEEKPSSSNTFTPLEKKTLKPGVKSGVIINSWPVLLREAEPILDTQSFVEGYPKKIKELLYEEIGLLCSKLDVPFEPCLDLALMERFKPDDSNPKFRFGGSLCKAIKKDVMAIFNSWAIEAKNCYAWQKKQEADEDARWQIEAIIDFANENNCLEKTVETLVEGLKKHLGEGYLSKIAHDEYSVEFFDRAYRDHPSWEAKYDFLKCYLDPALDHFMASFDPYE